MMPRILMIASYTRCALSSIYICCNTARTKELRTSVENKAPPLHRIEPQVVIFLDVVTNLFPFLWLMFGFYTCWSNMMCECHTTHQYYLLCLSSGLLIKLESVWGNWFLPVGSGCTRALHSRKGIISSALACSTWGTVDGRQHPSINILFYCLQSEVPPILNDCLQTFTNRK